MQVVSERKLMLLLWIALIALTHVLNQRGDSMKILSCEHPIRVYNKYIDEYMHVPCRKCSVCRNNKVIGLVNRLQYESQQWKHSLFFTLTYAPEFCPHYNLCYDAETNDVIFEIHDNTTHLADGVQVIEEWYNEDGESYSFFKLSDYPEVAKDADSLAVIRRCLDTDGQLRVVYKPHVQRFLKRLNFYFKNHYPYEKFRYFVVSEYGADKTKNYRPHYHGLLFFNSTAFAKEAYQVLCKTWKFGFVGASVPYSKAIAYCAKYINSINYYPKVYDFEHTRPFYLSSRRPAIGVHQISDSEVKEIILNGVNDFMLYDRTQIKNVPFWRAFEGRYFPKCREFNKISHHDRILRYSYRPFPYDKFDKRFWHEYKVNLSDEQIADVTLARRVQENADYFGISLEQYVKRIEDYYIFKDLLNLVNFYEYQEQKSREPDGLKSLFALYPEALNDFKEYVHLKLQKLDELPFGIEKCTDYIFRKLNPYLNITDRFNDWLDIDFDAFDYSKLSDYKKLVADNKKIEKDSVKTKKLNEKFEIL